MGEGLVSGFATNVKYAQEFPWHKVLFRQITLWSTIAALTLLAARPLFDIAGEKAGPNAVDFGSVTTAAGAVLMAFAMLTGAASADRMPWLLFLILASLAALLVLSAISYLALSSREELLTLFSNRRTVIYGAYVAPESGIPREAIRLLVSFAPLALIAVMLRHRNLIPGRLLKAATWVILSGALIHCAIAWLQVVGVVEYSFYFQIPGVYMGRPSGGYYHPMSLGRLLIFAVFMLYALRAQLRLTDARHYVLIAVFLGTGAISMHRLTMLSLAIVVVAFELPRLRAISARGVSKRLMLRGIAVTAAVVGLVSVLWGEFILSRAQVMLSAVGSWNVGSDRFLNGRGAIWSDVATIVGKSPWDIWLFGFGYEPWDMHNDLLRVGIVWGLAGIALMAAVLVLLHRFSRHLVTQEGRRALAILYVVLIFFGLTQKPTSYPYFMWLFLFCHMVIIMFHRKEQA